MLLGLLDGHAAAVNGGCMKLVNRKTRKAIKKSVRKAMKKHGPALTAGLASSLASTLATLANTKAPGKRGKSNLTHAFERLEESLTDGRSTKPRHRDAEKKRKRAATGPAEESRPR
jgi:hypothetical protein